MLHPQAQALLRLMEEKGVPPTHTLTPAEARAFYRERRTFTQPDAARSGAGARPRSARPGGPHPAALATGRSAARPARCCRCWSTSTAAAG